MGSAAGVNGPAAVFPVQKEVSSAAVEPLVPFSVALLEVILVAALVVTLTLLLGALIVLVVRALTVGEFTERTIPLAVNVTVMLSAGELPLQEAAVERATKNLPPSSVLLLAVFMVVGLPIFTVLWLPASKSETELNVPLPLSL